MNDGEGTLKITKEMLREWQSVDLHSVSRDELVDLKDVDLDLSMSYKDRFLSFVQQVKNPYLFKVGKLVVKIAPGTGTGDFREALARGIVNS